MSILLLDAEVYNRYIKVHFPKSARGFVPALLLVSANPATVEKLKSLPAGDKRVKYFLSNEFQNQIEIYVAAMYNIDKGIFVLDENSVKYIKPIIEYLQETLPKETLLWISIPVTKIKNISQTIFGFKDPHKTTLNPLYSSIPASIALTRINSDPIVEYDNTKKIQAILHNTKASSCTMKVRLTKNAVDQLKNLCYSHEKELTGELYVKDVDHNLVYIVDILDGSISSGEHEAVDVEAVRFNFHSHPHAAYVSNRVANAWPSGTDYIGMTILGTDTIFHLVTTKEGLYVISFAEGSSGILNKITSEFIETYLNIDLDRKLQPKEVVKMVNNVKYDNQQVFQLQFLPWKKVTTPFEIAYAQTDGVCIVSQDGAEKHKKMFSS